MATREENLKKINDALEKMSDEELEQVAGGTYGQTERDSIFLFNLGLLDEQYSSYEIMFSSSTWREEKIRKVFEKFGIGFCYHGVGRSNDYYYGNSDLSQKEAWKVVKEKAKKMKLGKYA